MSLKTLIKEINYIIVFFENLKVPSQSIKNLIKLNRILEESSINSLDELNDILNNGREQNAKTKNNKTKININDIVSILKKKNNKTNIEKELLEIFFEQHPNLKDIEKLPSEDLFHLLNSKNVSNWKKDELKFILYFYFNFPVKGSETKDELYTMIKDFSLQLNHIQSFSINQKKS